MVLIDLDEGPRFLPRLVGAGAPSVASGDRVRLRFIPIEGHKLPYVERLTEEASA